MRRTLLLLVVVTTLISAPSGTALAAKKKPAMMPRSSSSSTAACNIKGNISTKGDEKIYHLPTCASYTQTIIDEASGERWFCSEKQAQDAGWRKAKNCKK
jgi:hypothetical protein